MQKLMLPLLLLAPCAAYPALAETYHTGNLLRDAITPIHQLTPGSSILLTGELGREPLVAEITLREDSSISNITLQQGERSLLMPSSAWNDRGNAKFAWLEKRGSLTTIVLEGEEADGRDWRLALQFHSKQIWKRRLSIENQNRDIFTYYSRKDMLASKPQRRAVNSRGLYEKDNN